MTTNEALFLLTNCQTCRPQDLPCEPQVRHHPQVPLTLCALANLSGMLDEADSWEQLCAAIEHARSLFSCGVLKMPEWDAEITKIVIDLADDPDTLEPLN